jgi:mannose/cellobiose epimerase-like protein (N-acyl-D-glucosamine 2-epimerase family)
MNETGSPENSTKYTMTQARNVFAMTHAFMVTGNEDYLDYARRALDWMYSHSWDDVNGWHGDPTGFRYFWEFYDLMGVITTYEVTRRDSDKEMLDKSWNLINTHLWDTRAGYEGYFINADANWANPNGKGFGPSGDALNTHAVNIYLGTGEEKHLSRLEQIGDNVVDHLIADMDNCKLGFREVYSSDWEPVPDDNLWVGHFIKTAWCLGRVHLTIPKPEYKSSVAKIIDNTWNDGGWDHTYGASPRFASSSAGTATDNRRCWWDIEQAVNAGLIGWYITGQDNALQMADEGMDFYMKHCVDHVNSETWEIVSADGSSHESSQKGNEYKAGYHSTELGWLTYWYASLYYKKQAVKVYYRFYPESSARKIHLWPEAIENEKLVVTKILKDDEEFENYDGKTRTINLAANEEGVFKVTFDLAENTSASRPLKTLKKATADINANITNGWLSLRGLNPADAGEVTICRLNGAVVLSKKLPTAAVFATPVSSLNSGVYLVRITEGGQAITRRISIE